MNEEIAGDGGQESWGFQLVLDCFGCGKDACCDLDRGYDFLDKICLHLGMTKQTQPYIFKTCDVTFPGKPGYSGWVPIIESGIQIHTSANNQFISIDVYSCRRFDEAGVVDFVKQWFQPSHIETCFLYRGKNIQRRCFGGGDDAMPAAAVPATDAHRA
jgi:S-adenosylmethionine decarboxylase